MRDETELPDITPALLLQAYAAGVFPMGDTSDAQDIVWIDPDQRGILPLDALHVSRSLRKRIRQSEYNVRFNSRFVATVKACAAREDTWINDRIMGLYTELHRSGYAHSVEVWHGDDLVGGLYGVAIGGAFFGESMFSTRTDCSKIALVYLVARLRVGGFELLDTQFVTDHLRSLGAIEIARSDYHTRLHAALTRPANFWHLARDADPQSILQLSTQMS